MLSSREIRRIERRDGGKNLRLRRLHNTLAQSMLSGGKIYSVILSDGTVRIPVKFIAGDTLWSAAERAYINAYDGIDSRSRAAVILLDEDGEKIAGSSTMVAEDDGRQIGVQWAVDRVENYDPSTERYTVYWRGFNAPTFEPLENIEGTDAHSAYLNNDDDLNSAAEILASLHSSESSMIDS